MQADATTIKLTSSLIVEQLLTEGTSMFFVAPRSMRSPLAKILSQSRNNITVVNTLSELTAVFMATGYGQASSRVPVVILPAGQGLVSCLAAIYTASRMRIPMVIIQDDLSTPVLNDDPPLTVDSVSIARPLCKWAAQARSAHEIPRLIRRAFTEAMAPPKGPVFLSIPADITQEPVSSPLISPPHTSPLGAADHNFILKTARSLVAAQSPAIIAGNEVSQFRARKEVATLAEVIGCPVYTEPMPTGVNFPNRHPQFAGVLPLSLTQARDKIASHDLILMLGMQTRLPGGKDQAGLLSSRTSVIQINIEPTLAGKSLPCIAAANADLAETLSRLRAEIQLIADTKWCSLARGKAQATIDNVSKDRQKIEEELVYPKPSEPVSLFWLLRTLDGARPTSSIVVTDLVGSKFDPSFVMSFEGSSSYFASNSGVDGFAAAAALGTHWASPENPVIAITTDQSLLQCPQALWTAAHYNLNVKFIIVNSRGANNLASEFEHYMSEQDDCSSHFPLDKPEIEYPLMSQSMRVAAAKVETMAELEAALTKVFEDKNPCCIDVRIAQVSTS
ncbi:MAG: thiamine pyrophosphate-binding protein [Cyanobacteria bacterium SZAS TMP-1]|nr:thiamine pyrophosphate-binding protein [Cyanobacteria bacterium SZAS TMP-1]